jgi:ACS family glucarate transporter-like MFS transporter
VNGLPQPPDAVPSRPTRVRYVVIAVVTLAAVLLYLHRFCFSFLERFIRADLHLSNDQIALLLSAFFWSYALAQVPSGWLCDRFGTRLMLFLFILLWSVCTGLLGAATAFAVLLALRLSGGLTQAGAYPASAALVGEWVPFRRRGLASGIVAYGGRLGGAVAPVLTAYLLLLESALPDPVHRLYGQGWRPVFFVYGAAGVLVAGLFWVVFRNRPEGHPACNAAEVLLIRGGRVDPVDGAAPARGLPIVPVLRSRSLWLISLSQFLTNFGWIFLLTWLPRYLAEVHDVPVVRRGWLAGLPLFVGMFGQLAGGWLTDALVRSAGLRWGRCLPMALSRFAGMTAFALCPLLRTPVAVTAALAVVALATDLGTPASWAYVQDVSGRHTAAVLGWANMWGNVGAAVSPLALNAVVARWGWPALFLACAAAYLFSGLAVLGVDATIPVFPNDKAAD